MSKSATIEVIGNCKTNTTQKSQHCATVEYSHLWSYAQEAALIAVSDWSAADGAYKLITDPERRAKRIAAHYAQLYFDSSKKSNDKVQFYWVALAAFVVKDIVEAYRFAREEVLQDQWKDTGSAARNSLASEIGSQALSSDSAYQHVLRTYAALAKGNLWLFMDIYPWYWFFLEYGISEDGTTNCDRLNAAIGERSFSTFQRESKAAVEALPFGPNWMDRLSDHLEKDPVYMEAVKQAKPAVYAHREDGLGQAVSAERNAHNYAKSHAKDFDKGYRTPPGQYWQKFPRAYSVMTAEHQELGRLCSNGSVAEVEKAREFGCTSEVRAAYQVLIDQAKTSKSRTKQLEELTVIASHEQKNVLQPLIYDDAKLKETMDMNHRFSRMTGGWISPQFKVIYRSASRNDDPDYEAVFDPPAGIANRFSAHPKSLPNVQDRMEFVKMIARKFDGLMATKRPQLEQYLREIARWRGA